MIGTYMFHNPETDEAYIGSGIIDKRKSTHLRTLKNGTHHNRKFQDAYNRNPNFEFISVELVTTEEAREYEQGVINDLWGNPLLLNLSKHVTAGTPEENREIRDKISASLKARYAEGMVHSNLGRKHTQETLAQYSVDRIGNKNALGSKHSDEWKNNQSQRMVGNTHLVGHSHSDETKERMSKAHTGKSKSPEAVAAAAKNRTSKNVLLNGELYLNSAAVAKIVGISKTGVDRRCLSENFPNYEFVPVIK